MNKPLLAAVAGVSFGLFLGGLSFYGLGARTCQRRATVDHVPLTRVVVQKTVVAHPCPSMQDEPQADSAPTLDRSDPDSVLSYAQTLYVNGDYAQAISVAKSVESKSRVRAARIIGSAACNLRDTKLADEAYRKLDAPGRQYMVYVCQRQGVTINGRHFRLAKDE
jgi:hypothetical protein